MDRKLLSQINTYMFNKKESIVVRNSDRVNHGFESTYEQTKTIAAMLRNLHDLGYEIPRDEVDLLMNMSVEDLKTDIYDPLLKEAKSAKGADVEHRLLFPGFPESVKQLDIDTLSDIRFMSYFTTVLDSLIGLDSFEDGSITRELVGEAFEKIIGLKKESKEIAEMSNEDYWHLLSEKVDKELNKINEKATTRTIHLVKESEFFNMVKNMLSARTSLSEYDKEIVLFAVDNFNKELYMPDKIQFRETQAMLDKYNFSNGNIQNINVRTVTDYERLLVALSDGDLSLSQKQKVRNFSNQERKLLATIFKNALNQNMPTMVESAANRQTLRFLDNVLTKRLHFNQIKDMEYTKFVKRAKSYENTMSIYERCMSEHKYDTSANILAKHSPTLFAQHAKDILSKAYFDYNKDNTKEKHEQIQHILKKLAESAKKTDIKTLLSLKREIEKPKIDYKIMIPKGPKLSVVVKENKTLEFPVKLVAPTIKAIEQGIGYQLQNCEMKGKIQIDEGTKVYVDPNLSDCPIPTMGRSDTGKNRTVAAGTKLNIEKCDVLRAALYKNHNKNQFIDFSCAFLGEDYKFVGQVSWNNLVQTANGTSVAWHSGDTSACTGKGCTEIIDVNLNAVKERFPEAKYIAYSALMWNSNPLSSCNKLFMTLAPTKDFRKEDGKEISKDNAMKVYDPANVQFKVDITGDGVMSIPLLYDIDANKVIIMNLESKHKDFKFVATNPRHFDLPKGCECLENYSTDLSMKCFAINTMDVPTILDLVDHYIEYRKAERVERPEEADVIFATDRITVKDEREQKENQELVEQVVVSPFDKDIITAELIPDPKTIVERDVREQLRQLVEIADNNDIERDR